MADSELSIFAAELDDDFIRRYGAKAAEDALSAYLLLSDSVILHPAYFWQYPQAKALVLKDAKELLKPPRVKIILGKNESTGQYLSDRIRKLECAQERLERPLVELHQYKRTSKDDRKKDCEELNEHFLLEDGAFTIGWSRDKMFRSFVLDELKRDSFDGNHLFPLVLRAKGSLAEAELRDIVRQLVDEVEGDKGLVSCDTIIAALEKNGLRRDRLAAAEERLHNLHWKAHIGVGLQVPLVSRIEDAVDPFDPAIFWFSMEYLVGKPAVLRFCGLPWQYKVEVANDLREDDVWIRFMEIYREIVQTAAKNCRSLDKEAVLKEMHRLYPSKLGFIIPTLDKVGLTFFAVSSLATISPLLTGFSHWLLASILPGGYEAVKVRKRWAQAAEEFDKCDRNEIRRRLSGLLERVTLRDAGRHR